MAGVCAWCGKQKEHSETESGAESHGICASCAARICENSGPALQNVLNRFHSPVLAVDSNGCIISANHSALLYMNISLDKVAGKPGGDAMECAYADLPGGCGETVHCKGCAIRNAVMQTMSSGKGVAPHEAYRFTVNADGSIGKLKLTVSTCKTVNGVILWLDE